MKKRTVFWLVVITTVILLGVFVSWALFFAVRSSEEEIVRRLRADLAAARQRWSEVGPPEYQIDVEFLNVSIYWFQCVSTPGQLELRVRDGVVIEPDDQSLDQCREMYQGLTVEGMFDRVDAAIDSYDHRDSELRVRYDQDLGYVDWYETREIFPIWSAVPDTVTRVTVRNFQGE